MPIEPLIFVPYHGESVLSTYLYTLEVLESRLEDVELVCEFHDVYQEIPGIPPHRVEESRIDLVPYVSPVSKVVY